MKSAIRCNVPVLFLVFNRPDTTARVFDAIRRVKPPQLFVAADGARQERQGEARLVEEVREIATRVDWPCDVRTLFRTDNLGCKKAVSSAITWFFDNVPEGIILEDDCLPAPSFFPFCEELLERYRADERVGIISGDNFQFGRRRTTDSYYFTRYAHIWGWASWRSTWREYDAEMKQWPKVKKEKWLVDILQDRKLVDYWRRTFDAVFDGRIDTWDYQLNFATWIHAKLNIVPNVNLVSNIGFGAAASRTTEIGKFSEMAVGEMTFPVTHPRIIVRDALADRVTEREQFRVPPLASRIKSRLRRAMA